MTYLCFFTGPAIAAKDDIILRFNDLWMQYGGRPFRPWSPYEGGTDLTYCLGTENAVAAYSAGLEYSRRIGKVLDIPATVTIPANGGRVLRYGTLFAPYSNDSLSEGIKVVEEVQGALICTGAKGESWHFPADQSFAILKRLEKTAHGEARSSSMSQAIPSAAP
jgi:hypothetical protein